MQHNKFDDQLKEYFQQHKTELKDDGFKEELMRKLPRKEKQYYIVYLLLFIGMFILVMLNGHEQLVVTINEFTLSIPPLKTTITQSLTIIVLLLVVFSVSIIGFDRDDSMISI